MAWIRVVDDNEGSAELLRVYRKIRGARGQVANVLKVQSLRPAALEAHLALYRATMFAATGLTRAQREMIAVIVSVGNRCHY